MLGGRADALRAARPSPVVQAVAVAEGETLLIIFKQEISLSVH
jgi:hypothetical protein